MKKPSKNAMVKIPLEDFQRACTIVAEMDSLIKDNVQDKMNMLLMSSTYENLSTAAGILSGYLPDKTAGLTVSRDKTRQSIRTAYAHLEAAKTNTRDESTAQAACLQLQACLFTILNARYIDNKFQESVENIMAAATCGLEIVNGLIDAGPESLDLDYLSDAGQKLTEERMELIKNTLSALLPRTEIKNQNPEVNA